MENKVIISADNLSIGYHKEGKKQENILYKNLSFNLIEGELTCLIGANGAGKSTLIRTLTKMQEPISGEIKLLNKNLEEYTDKDLSQLIGLVLTDKSMSGGFTVKEIVELGRYPYTGFFGNLDDNDKRIVEAAMQDVNIAHKKDSFIADLSDGERQKVMISKALSQECPIIILDEPTAFLDVESRIEIMNLLHDLAHKKQKTILLSTHDIDLAFLLSDKLWMLTKEAELITGVTEDIILSGQIENFFRNENIAFNKYSGSFYPIRKGNIKVFVDAKDELLFWTINLLLRLGLDYTTRKEESEYTLKVDYKNSIDLTKNNITLTFNSFEELANYLRSAQFS